MTIIGSTIRGNRAAGGTCGNRCAGSGVGGGIAVSSLTGPVLIVNSTISGNGASGGDASVSLGHGSGGCLWGGSGITIVNSTITGNGGTWGDANDAGGGGIYSTAEEDDQGPILINTIVAGNLFGELEPEKDSDDIYGRVQSRGYNFIGDTFGAIIDVEGNGNTDLGNILDQDPLLGPLADNGGPTKTHALLPGSPAIDGIPVESCTLETDQRGIQRPGNLACDFGAFELDLEVFSLKVVKTGIGNGTIVSDIPGVQCGDDCTELFLENQTITLVAAVDQDSVFVGWSGPCAGTGPCVVGPLTSDVIVEANYRLRTFHRLQVTIAGAPGGNVWSFPPGVDCVPTCTGLFFEGIAVTLRAAPYPGWEFLGWSGESCSGTQTCVVPIHGAAQVRAEFGFISPGPIRVNTTDDEVNWDGDCSLREALVAARARSQWDMCVPSGGAGDAIVLAPGTYTLGERGSVVLDVPVSIVGAGRESTVVQASVSPGVSDFFLMRVDTTKFVLISGLTIQNGWGGVVNNSGTLRLLDSTVRNIHLAGGVSTRGLTLTVIVNSSIENNSTAGVAGTRNDEIRVLNSTIRGNTGGGLIAAELTTVINSTISGNTGPDTGWAGVFVGYDDSLTLINSTVVDNVPSTEPSTRGPGGGITLSSTSRSSATIINSIIANNPPVNCSEEGTIVSLGHNINSDGTCRFNGPGDLPNTDPLLGPLAHNGGPTLTHAPLPGSPAIDAGDPSGCVDADDARLTTDQRGIPRPLDGDGDGSATCDIGAFELVEETSMVDVGVEKSASVSQVYAGGTVTYSIAVTNHSGITATNVIVTDSLPPGTSFQSADESCAVESSAVKCKLGDLGPGTSRTVSITITVDSSAAGTIVNTAEAEADEGEIDTSNNSASALVEVLSEVAVSPLALDTVRLGEEFQVEIRGDRLIDLAGAQLTVTFDSSVVEFVDAAVAQEFSACQVLQSNPTSGRVALAFVCPQGRSGNDLPLWRVTFRHIGDPQTTETQIAVEDLVLASGATPSIAIPGRGSLTTVTIYLGACGDLNDDDLITIVDAAIMIQIVVGLYPPTAIQNILADLDGSGVVEVVDVITALQYIVGLIPALETCG